MNRPLLISAMMLLCLLAPLTRAEQANGKLAQVLSAKRDEIRALGSQPCAPTKDPCTYGKEIGATLSKMAQDIVSQNNLEAKEGKVLFTEWINNFHTKYADVKCAQAAFSTSYAIFAKSYHRKVCPPHPRGGCPRETLHHIRELEVQLQEQMEKTCKYKSLYEREKLDFQLHNTQSLEEKAKLKTMVKEFLRRLDLETITKQVRRTDHHLHSCHIHSLRIKKRIEHLESVVHKETDVHKKVLIQKKINKFKKKLVSLKKKEKVLIGKSIREHKKKVVAIKKELKVVKTLVHNEHHEHHEIHSHHSTGCTPGHYISTTEIRESIRKLQRQLLIKGHTCGYKEKILEKIISLEEEMIKVEWKNIHKIQEELAAATDCEQKICLKRRLIHRQEHVLEIRHRIYELQQRLDRHKLHDLRAAADVSKEIISQLHQKIKHASDSEMIDMRANLKHEVDNLNLENIDRYCMVMPVVNGNHL